MLRRARLWGLALLGVVVGHEAVYLAAYGDQYATAMARTGHWYWLAFALLGVVVGGIPIAATIAGIVRLRGAIRRNPDASSARSHRRELAGGPSYLGEFASLLPRLFLLVLIGFTIQENVEGLLTFGALPGLHVLDSLMALQVLFAISCLICLAGAWLRWREAVLEARFCAAPAPVVHAPVAGATPDLQRWTGIAASVAHQWLLARGIAGRAPPFALGR
jgi:hypothetical protein